MDKYFLNKISSFLIQDNMKSDLMLIHHQPKPNLTTESHTDRQAHAVLEVPVLAITTNCLGWKIFFSKIQECGFFYCYDDYDG